MKHHRQLVFNGIMEAIAKGEVERGEKLPSENALAQRLGVKRSDVRDALMALEMMGLVYAKQGQGCYLVDFELTEASNPLALLVMLQKGNPREIMYVRSLLETEAAKLCAVHRTKRIVTELTECFEKMIVLKQEYREYAVMDASFHSIVAKGSANKLLQNIIHLVSGYISYVSLNNWMILTLPENETHKKAIIEQHRLILGAIKKGHPQDAAQSVRNHLSYIIGNLNQRIKEDYSAYEKQASILWT